MATAEAKTYTLPEIAELASAHYRTLKSWVDRGLLAPSVRDAQGTGNVCFYSERDLQLALLLANLRRRGLDIEALTAVAAELRHDPVWVCPVCRTTNVFEDGPAADFLLYGEGAPAVLPEPLQEGRG